MSEPRADAVYPALTYRDAHAAIQWLCDAFGFRARLVVPGPEGTVMHSELSLGSVVIMVSSPKDERRSPLDLGGVSGALSVSVPDPDAHHERARAHGAKILREVRDEDYGSRGYMAQDIEGHCWYFGTYRAGAHWD